MPGVTWTEGTVTAVTHFEGTPQGFLTDGFALFGMPIPLSASTVWADSTATLTESTVPSGTITETTVNSTAYTETSI